MKILFLMNKYKWSGYPFGIKLKKQLSKYELKNWNRRLIPFGKNMMKD